MELETLKDLVVKTLDDMKGQDIKTIDVRGKSSITDMMVIVTGNSNRHVKSLADSVELAVKAAGMQPLGIEGDNQSDWVLLDLNEIILHSLYNIFFNETKVASIRNTSFLHSKSSSGYEY